MRLLLHHYDAELSRREDAFPLFTPVIAGAAIIFSRFVCAHSN
jgi:hypothetical protein